MDTVAFWKRFVDQLLCADVEDVTEVEMCPFDRALIIQDTGSAPGRNGEEVLEITIVETGITSVAPRDQG